MSVELQSQTQTEINPERAIALKSEGTNRCQDFEHFQVLVRDMVMEDSGCDIEQFDACVVFHEDQEFLYGGDVITPIHDQLNTDFHRFSHQVPEPVYAAFLMNEDGSVWQAILSVWDDDKNRWYIYRAPKNNGDRAFKPPIPPSIRKKISARYAIEVPMMGSFWDWLAKVGTEIPRIPTEGFKKALCALSMGYVAIALYGCWCGAHAKDAADMKVDPYLIPDLEPLAEYGTTWLFGFDRDEKQSAKNAVCAAKKRFTTALTARGCLVGDIIWQPEQGKGIDDLVKSQGSGAFDWSYLQAVVKLEKTLSRSSPLTKSQRAEWTQKSLADDITKNFREQLAWHLGNKCWYWYNNKLKGVWAQTADELIGRLVSAEIKSRIGPNFNHDRVAGTIKLLKYELAVDSWHETQGLIPLQDCVLDPVTLETFPHAPEYRFLWQLPYQWADRAIGCAPVANWLSEIMDGDATRVQLLRAYLKAIVTGRADLHRFLEAVGPGGTGKTTYQRLAVALVGKENTLTTTLVQLENNRFETAALYGKRLLLIADSERYGGEVAVLKAITGQDPLRVERKGIQQSRGFTFAGMVLVAANEAIQSSDYTSGLKRRRLSIPFTHETPPNRQKNLLNEFQPYLPGVLQWVLDMPEAEMVSLIKDTENSVRSLSIFNAEFLMDTNPLAEWLDNCAVLSAKEKTYVGTLNKSSEFHLYPNYCQWVQSTGSRPLSLRRFSENLLDLCSSQLKVTGVRKSRDAQGVFITGIGLRHHLDTHKRPITGMLENVGLGTEIVELVKAETFISEESVECVGLNLSDTPYIEHSATTKDQETIEDIALYTPVNPAQAIALPNNSSSNESNISHQTELTKAREQAQERIELPPVGSWVKIEGKVARVIKHHPEASDTVILDGQPAGNFTYGGYQISDCVVLTKLEVLEMGLKSS